MDQTPITKEDIHLAILNSPLDSLVQTLAISKLKQSAELVEKVIRDLPFRSPEDRIPEANSIMGLIYQIFTDNSVPESNARDTYRNVYEALGGAGDVQYEVQS